MSTAKGKPVVKKMALKKAGPTARATKNPPSEKGAVSRPVIKSAAKKKTTPKKGRIAPKQTAVKKTVAIKKRAVRKAARRSAPASIISPHIRERLFQYALLTRMDRPIGTFLLLWPPLVALWIASEGRPDGWVLVVFILGTFLMRSAGCAINDFADRKFDPHVKRTAQRPVASGKVSPKEALAVFGVLSLVAFGLVLTLNWLTIALSFCGVVLAATYPFAKRYTYLPQVHLGAAFGWAVPMAFAAQSGEVPAVAWLLFIATVVWATVYDTLYAMVDRDDDIRIGVRSTAVLFGDADRVIIGLLQLTLLFSLIMVGSEAQLGLFYGLGLTVAGGLCIYHQYLIRKRQPQACFKAFLHNNWLGVALFAGVVAHYLYIG